MNLDTVYEANGSTGFYVDGTWYSNKYYLIEANTLYVITPNGLKAIKKVN